MLFIVIHNVLDTSGPD